MRPSQPPDGSADVGFGYLRALDDYPSEGFIEPLNLAPGALENSILSDSDHDVLNNFFYSTFTNPHSMNYGEGVNPDHALPPHLISTGTTFGHEYPVSTEIEPGDLFNHNFPYGVDSMLPPPQLAPHRSAPQPALHSPPGPVTPAEAAVVLTSLHNGLPHRPNGIDHGVVQTPQPMVHPPSHPPRTPRNHLDLARSHPGHVSSIPMLSPMKPLEGMPTRFNFSGAHPGSAARYQAPEDVQWGSDTNFATGQLYESPHRNGTSEALAEKNMRYMQCLELNKNGASTQPPSPTATEPLGGRVGKTNGHVKIQADASTSARSGGKRKVNDGEQGDQDSAYGPPRNAKTRKSKPNTRAAEQPSAVNGTMGKRRKSSANGSKPPRENLSDEQKRQNHILSEQKRRTLIKEGYELLQVLIPELKHGGYSKSHMLQIAGDWLDSLKSVNSEEDDGEGAV